MSSEPTKQSVNQSTNTLLNLIPPQAFLSRGADPLTCDGFGSTPLHHVCFMPLLAERRRVSKHPGGEEAQSEVPLAMMRSLLDHAVGAQYTLREHLWIYYFLHAYTYTYTYTLAHKYMSTHMHEYIHTYARAHTYR